ncbi:hypothetical protein E4U35_008088 [Claviceps purpurea]|nr:hypothetical protein E4U38_003215 [Claviceps purpurea]KAG6145147.1 hypothetical protein E4U12_000082 [Claviceps purpurea]KAG6147684.1 hypothetical protein E4U28_006372 [Claviceps purpurea]KAG6156174.1 hypothetical protein E4U37_000524 [Claviceps purpurea]KAG6162631.1 hypothetical protein E4U51_006254 [Claviceps purpurea]
MYRNGSPPVADVLPSSPTETSSSPANPFLSPTRTGRRKEKRKPSVTPRRFGRFFTPRSSLATAPRMALGVLNASATNSQMMSPQSLAGDLLSSDPLCPSSPTEGLGQSRVSEGDKRKNSEEEQPAGNKRRRGSNLDNRYPPPTSWLGRRYHMSRDGDVQIHETIKLQPEGADGLDDQRRSVLRSFYGLSRSGSTISSQEESFPATPNVRPSELRTNLIQDGYRPKPTRKFRSRGFEAQMLDREHGFGIHAGKQYLQYPYHDSRVHTASFYSQSSDVHHCTAHVGEGETIPFSLASSPTDSTTAIGDESGFVRLLRTRPRQDGVASHLGPEIDEYIKVHDNAIMDLDFSQDGYRLATASGDRTSRIVDVVTSSVAVELAAGHWDSLRQVAFQPGKASGFGLATSDRAGRVQLWDLRCSSTSTLAFSSRGGLSGSSDRDTTLDIVAVNSVNTIDNAHERIVQGVKSSASVTAIQWLPSGREHLLLTASEANASIKLWDTRYIKPRRQAQDMPLACTPEPTHHTWRSYGLTSLALNTDASRLYAVCKDSTIYAYSTAHLMLGHAPELQDNMPKRRPNGGINGLGPLYGFKHDQFRASSFYIKCALRPASASDNQSELLAVGSANNCAILFPTDEKYMRTTWSQRSRPHAEAPEKGPKNPLPSSCSSSFPSGSSIPILRTGTPLVRGHSREVTNVSWSRDGDLVTASDDYWVRRWSTSLRDQARHLRTVGEFGGERYMAGWADVASDWDMDDE